MTACHPQVKLYETEHELIKPAVVIGVFWMSERQVPLEHYSQMNMNWLNQPHKLVLTQKRPPPDSGFLEKPF